MLRAFRFMMCVVLLLAAASPLYSAGSNDKKSPNIPIFPSSVVRAQQGYSMTLWINTGLVMGYAASEGVGPSPYGLVYPPNSTFEHLYSLNVLVAGVVNGDPRVAGTVRRPFYSPAARARFWKSAAGPQHYDPDGWSGYYYNNGIRTNRRDCDDDGDGKIDEDPLDGLDNDGDWNPLLDDVGADGLPDSIEVSCDGVKYDPILNPDPAQDDYDPHTRDKCHPDAGTGVFPFKNNTEQWTEKNGLPDHGEPHVDEDYGAISDNDLLCYAVDKSHPPFPSGRVPLGIRVAQKSYAWNAGFTDGILPFEYEITNTSTEPISRLVVSFEMDPDIGPVSVANYASHNYDCVFDTLRTLYAHNPRDRGSTPLGLTILNADTSLGRPRLFMYHVDPLFEAVLADNDTTLYGYLTGSYLACPDGCGFRCQSPENLSDVKDLISIITPGTLLPGQTYRLAIALISGDAVDFTPQNLRSHAEKAFVLYQRAFHLPIVPLSPSLSLTQEADGVRIDWGRGVGPIDPTVIWDDYNRNAEEGPDTSWRRVQPPCGIASTGCDGHNCVIRDGRMYLPGGRIFDGFDLYRSDYTGSGQPPVDSYYLLQSFPYSSAQFATSYVDHNTVKDKEYWYAVTTRSLPNIAILPVGGPSGGSIDTVYAESPQSPIGENAAPVSVHFLASGKRDVLVVPNPYRGDADYTTSAGGYEGSPATWDGTQRLIKFINLPRTCTIRIFSLAGDLITTLSYQAPPSNPDLGEMTYNLFSESGRPLASGVYVFSVESSLGTQVGKFVVIR